MTSTSHNANDAAFAADRLREVIDSMRAIWARSLDEVDQHDPVDLYAVDADVVKMFMDPEGVHAYGALLRYEGHARRIASNSENKDLETLEMRIVEFLGYFIFLKLRPGIPLILLPDHANDLETVIDNIGRKAIGKLETWKRVREAIDLSEKTAEETSKQSLIHADQALHESNGNRQAHVESFLDEIFKCLRGEGAIGELFRFQSLVDGDCICHLDRMKLEDEKGGPCHFPTPLDAKGRYPESVARLSERLRKKMVQLCESPTEQKRNLISSDARALSHLAWLNEFLAEQSWHIHTELGRRKVGRVILVTGSHLVRQAVHDLDIKALSRTIFAPLAFLGHRMMDEYVQKEMDRGLSPFEESTHGLQTSALINIFDSIRGLLKSAAKTHTEDATSIELTRSTKQLASLTESWQGRQLFENDSRMAVVSSAMEDLSQSGQSLERLEAFLETLSVKTWQSFARSVAMLSLKNALPANTIERNIPPIHFKHFKQARQIAFELLSDGKDSENPANSMPFLRQEALEKLKKEDPSHYTEFVCYALFGLVNRKFRIAEGCAEIALSIVERGPKGSNSKFIKGDEALFLLAHIIRLRARRDDELRRAEHCILLAIGAAKRLAEEEGEEVSEDMRLESERFSIECHNRYFESFGPVGSFRPASTSSRNNRKLESTFNDGIDMLNRLKRQTADNEHPYIYEYIRQKILVNLGQIAVLIMLQPIRIGDEAFQVFKPLEQNYTPSNFQENAMQIAQELASQCNELRFDKTGKLPKPSLLATAVAAVLNAVFLNNYEFYEQFSPQQGKIAAIDGIRYKYLECALNYGRKFDQQNRSV